MVLFQYHEKISRRLISYKKRLLFAMRKPYYDTLPIFIMGCGRSGTTMMTNTFQRDCRIEVLNENDPKIAYNYMLVHDKVSKAINLCKTPVLVMKPILNSFDASLLLQQHSRAKVIWMIRDYKDMIASTNKKFGPVVPGYIRDLILFNREDNWLSHGMPADTLEKLRKINSSSFSDYDYIALVWWSVNRTIILDGLHRHKRFLLLKYEEMVQKPDIVLKRVYDFIGLKYRKGITKYIHSASIGKGASIQLHPQAQSVCDSIAKDVTR